MKFGLQTLCGQDLNFGTWLQTYALRRFMLRSFSGFECFHVSDSDFIDIFRRNTLFLDFIGRDSYIKKKDLTCQDKLIVGSDLVAAYEQKWFKPADFIFGPIQPENRIMYAGGTCSGSTKNIPDWVIDEYFLKFKAVSVRELDTYGYMRANIRLAALGITYNIDPVFLIGRDEWESLARKPDMDLDDDFDIQYNPHSKSKPGLGIELYMNPKVGPAEFLWMILNCRRFITNSFHGVCFSIIFRKQVIIPYAGYKIDNLFKLLKIDKPEIIDYNSVMDVVSYEQKRSYEYLERSIFI